MPPRLTRGALIGCVAAFAAALGGTYAATAGGGAPGTERPPGARAVPLELPEGSGGRLSLGAAEALPALAPERSDQPAQVVEAPAPVPAAPRPSPARAKPSSVSRAPAPPTQAPPPALAPTPPPEPAPAPPAPVYVPAQPTSPRPPPVEFDDSG